MFTGIVSDCGTIASVSSHGSSLKRLRINASYDAETIALGASIACAGVCLTVVAFGARPEGGCWFEVDAAAETLALTTVGQWKTGKRINLERALKIGDELGGHLVSGHVDGLAKIIAREEVTAGEAGSGWGATKRFVLSVPQALSKFIAVKGSVALDGTSLTINTVEQDQFSVLLIPHTLQVTTWGNAKAGDLVNLEVDQMARYAARLAEVAARE
ncbi:MAG: riboflavin synthase [Hyphomicrobiales bacterium]|nr:riboflavin synthase [Hyphomicrobiales bacterium]